MDSKIKSAQREAEDVKVIMLDHANKAEEREGKLKDQRAEQLQSTSKTAKLKNATKLKVNQKMQYMRDNKGHLSILIVSAAIIIAVVIAMLVTKDKYDHRHSEVESVFEEP